MYTHNPHILWDCFHVPNEVAHYFVFNVAKKSLCHPIDFTVVKIIDPFVK